MHDEDTGRVVIVGCGPAGAALALLLARRGVPVTLLERERGFDRVFRGEGLMPSGVDALHQMGLAELLEAIPSRKLEAWDLYIDGEEIFSVPEPIDELGDLAVRVVPQPAFLEGVVQEASQHPSFQFEPGVTVRDLVRDGEQVVGVRVQSDAGRSEHRATLVVGCDGRASVVRKRAGLELALSSEHYDVAWFKLPAPARLAERCAMLLMASAAGQSACYTSWDGRLQFAVLLRKGAFRELRNTDWTAEMARAAPPWLAEHLRSVGDALEGPVLLDVVVGRCPRWGAPGLLLLGDAAHPMSPIRAQGINLALRDAIVAANHLVPVLAAGDAARAANIAAAIQEEREPEVVRSQTLQHRDVAGLDTRAAPFLMWLGKTLGRPLGRYAWAQRAWLRQQHDLRFGSTRVRLVV